MQKLVPTVMTQTRPVNSQEIAIKAALDLAAQKGWANVTFAGIADLSGLDLADLQVLFADKADILAALGRKIDQETLKGFAGAPPQGSTKDRLFEVLMARFDVLQNDRDGITAILADVLKDPRDVVVFLPHLGRSMLWMLEAAGVETSGWAGCARVAGLMAIYLKTLRVWKDDVSEDLSTTMAELDRNLSRAQAWGARLHLTEGDSSE